ncbi:MAG: universal stress protein [Thermoleophilia bacterium]|jgi:nucleotide-binding universal stress UspA family protein
MSTIVVGIDGSKHGEAALEFAAKEAALRGADLRVVYAWEQSMITVSALNKESVDRFEDDADKFVAAALARVAELQPQVRTEGKVVAGQPVQVLLNEAENATMLVVGARGRGGFASLLLGSVSQQLVQHATRPLVIVR